MCSVKVFSAPNLWTVALDDDDVLLAVTDGVTDNLTFSELGEVMRATATTQLGRRGVGRRGVRPQS